MNYHRSEATLIIEFEFVSNRPFFSSLILVLFFVRFICFTPLATQTDNLFEKWIRMHTKSTSFIAFLLNAQFWGCRWFSYWSWCRAPSWRYSNKHICSSIALHSFCTFASNFHFLIWLSFPFSFFSSFFFFLKTENETIRKKNFKAILLFRFWRWIVAVALSFFVSSFTFFH